MIDTEDIQENIQEETEDTQEELQENIPENNTENNINIEEIENIKKELEECKKYKDLFLRTAAEYENFRKRSEKEKENIYSDALSYVITNIISVGDSIDAALNLNIDNQEYKSGIELLKNQFDSSLKKLGVESFGEVNEKFNPDIHNAISHIDNQENPEENIISQVFQKGYKSETKIIRHAMVQVTN